MIYLVLYAIAWVLAMATASPKGSVFLFVLGGLVGLLLTFVPVLLTFNGASPAWILIPILITSVMMLAASWRSRQ